MYAEDAPEISIFNYDKEGFYEEPADYYLRPFNLAVEDHHDIWNNNHDCIGPLLETEVVLDWIMEFMVQNKVDPWFAFSFITRLTHDNINKVGKADQPYLDFLVKMQKQGILENTAVIFYSDHGIRFGEIRESYIGKLEERLPFAFILLPKWFTNINPSIKQHLSTNANRLTTFFDIHSTISDLLHFRGRTSSSGVHRSGRAISLFQEIPPSRTCESAGILPHWCTCHKQVNINTTEKEVVNAANVVVRKINVMLSSFTDMCSLLTLQTIMSASSVELDRSVLTFKKSLNDVLGRRVTYGQNVIPVRDVLITLKTQPSQAIFESTVRISPSRIEQIPKHGDGGVKGENDFVYELIGDISRINRYGSQSECIHLSSLKKYCFCI